jgi:hypothetical protein
LPRPSVRAEASEPKCRSRRFQCGESIVVFADAALRLALRAAVAANSSSGLVRFADQCLFNAMVGLF